MEVFILIELQGRCSYQLIMVGRRMAEFPSGAASRALLRLALAIELGDGGDDGGLLRVF